MLQIYMNKRPTPETDAVKFRIEDSNHFAVHVVHARRLERERDEAREELAAERALADWLANSLTACERWVNQACDVKIEANKALIEWKEARK